MDITNLEYQLKPVAAVTGCTLNVDERYLFWREQEKVSAKASLDET